MKIEILKDKIVHLVPSTGEFWHFKTGCTSTVYLRVGTVNGLNLKDYFYSIDLATGIICKTREDEPSIEILELVNPVLQFRPLISRGI